MHNFSTHNELMSCFLSINEKEKAKLDKYLEFLDETGVSKIIDEELNSSQETRGRNPFNPYKLFATIKPKIRPAEINFKKLLSECKPGENEKLRRNNRKYKRRNRP